MDGANDADGWFRAERAPRLIRLIAGGDWTVRNAPRLDTELQGFSAGDAPEAEIDASGLDLLDSSGAWLLVRTKRILEAQGKRISNFLFPEVYAPLIHTVEHEHKAPPVKIVHHHSFSHLLER